MKNFYEILNDIIITGDKRMNESLQALRNDYKKDFIELTEEIHKYGYRWEEIARTSEAQQFDSLKSYIEDGKLSDFLGKWWGCSIANLYFYDKTETETQAQIRWFHEVVEDGIDLPWLKILKKKNDDTFDYVIRSDEEKKDLRVEQHKLLKDGPFPPKVMFNMFAEQTFRRSLSERNDGWVLVSLGEILTYTFEWHLRRRLDEIQKKARLKEDLIDYFSEDGRKFVKGIWDRLMDKVGDVQEPKYYLEEVMLSWIRDVMENEVEYQDWWQKAENNYDWFVQMARERKGREKFQRMSELSDFDEKLILFAQILTEYWDYQFHEGKDLNWEKFENRLRFSPPLQVERFGTRNLVAFPTWLQWLRNGGKMVSTNAAFVFAGFYDTDIAKQYARHIQTIFILITQPDIARHAIPKLMLAKVGILAEATTYELRQPLSSLFSIIEMLLEKISQGQKISRTDFQMSLEDLRRAGELIERVSNDLLFLPTLGSLKLKTETINLNELLRESLNTCSLIDPSNKEGVDVVPDLQPNLPLIQGDEDHLKHAFLEIIINAKEAMNGRQVKRLSVTSREIDDTIIVTFSDTGKGIDEKVQSKVFDSFYSTKEPKGIGLGLFNVKHIIELHGGKVNLISLPEKGTKIDIIFPKPNKTENQL
jgi:signal transduction histidine kinase